MLHPNRRRSHSRSDPKKALRLHYVEQLDELGLCSISPRSLVHDAKWFPDTYLCLRALRALWKPSRPQASALPSASSPPWSLSPLWASSPPRACAFSNSWTADCPIPFFSFSIPGTNWVGRSSEKLESQSHLGAACYPTRPLRSHVPHLGVAGTAPPAHAFLASLPPPFREWMLGLSRETRPHLRLGSETGSSVEWTLQKPLVLQLRIRKVCHVSHGVSIPKWEGKPDHHPPLFACKTWYRDSPGLPCWMSPSVCARAASTA